jgi:hypothetical protein
MLEDIERLRENPRLVELLVHYAALGMPDRSIWKKRLNEKKESTRRSYRGFTGS